MFSTADTVHAIVLCTLDIVAILLNALLLFAILTRTPPPMRAYSILLMNNAFVDTFSATSSMLAIARLNNLRGGAQLFVFAGPCSYLGRWFCHLCQTIHIFFVCHSTVVLMQSFCFRLYIVSGPLGQARDPAPKITLLICLLLYSPTVFVMIFYYTALEYTPPDMMREMHLEDYATVWYPNFFEYRFMMAMFFIVLLSPLAMLAIFFVRRRLIRHINNMVNSENFVKMLYIQALTYQMLLPMGVALASIAWIANVAGIWTDEVSTRIVMTSH
ncbi:hypothetical protein PMAYCL1PPCAC_09937 [Pristionchus mayeri]|uniref:G protein-coupled receptor n=1 Tax=Pristionchus mayeri TaxID=1317129 RepID=A0AAN4ZEI4_9BILA|nr:hypothetical protein PMAYCL1PPCAC_09937 [Pristionchus mayeri]